MKWLPTFDIFRTCICDADREVDGHTLQVSWFGLVIEITIGWESAHG